VRRELISARSFYSSVPNSIEKSDIRKANNSGSRSNHRGKAGRAMKVVAEEQRLTGRTVFAFMAYPSSG
jgi:hypothetical protein